MSTLCQCHTVLITIGLQLALKSESMNYPILFFLPFQYCFGYSETPVIYSITLFLRLLEF